MMIMLERASASGGAASAGPLIVTQDDLRASPELLRQVGGKAAGLARLQQQGLPVPDWIVVLPDAFDVQRLTFDVQRSGGSFADVRERLGGGVAAGDELPSTFPVAQEGATAAERRPLREEPTLPAALEAALERLCAQGQLLAVRSSALEEDGLRASFAGQLESYLQVAPQDVPRALAAVWRSGFDERVLAYRRARGLDDALAAPAVLIQQMVQADVSGVAFSADPVSGRRGVVVIAAVAGLGAALVAGELDGERYEVAREGAVARPAGPGTAALLSDDQARAIAALARSAERCFGRPQDVEWALRDGALFVLQSRPITTLAGMADPDGAVALWDNSNIVESYAGITTPLTFSFARRAYEQVYRQFCRMMGVPEATIKENDPTFQRMLGLIDGRMYYNLLSWYKVLSLLPGFTLNRRFMEQMMGVKESVAEADLQAVVRPSRGARLRDGLRLARTCAGLVASYLRLPRHIRRFRGRLDDALGSALPDLRQLRPDELARCYRQLEGRLLSRWDAPIVNDFFAMIFFGLLKDMARRWCGDERSGLAHALLARESGIISAEPAALVAEMARSAAAHPALVDALRAGTVEEIHAVLGAAPGFADQYDRYLERFGDRCMEELKLESLTLRDDPLPLLRLVGRLAASGPLARPGHAAGQDPCAEAERRLDEVMAGRPLRRAMLRLVLGQARRRIRDRENLRFERTRVFGGARRLFLELGRRLAALELLDDPRDVFYLEVDELLGFVEGTTTCPDLRGLVSLRRAVFARYHDRRPPASRFKTHGAVHQGNAFQAEPAHDAASHSLPDGERRGLGCSPGVVRARARVVRDPRGASLQPGEILVAEHTDPGWILLFPAAAGLIVERGSLLSHSAIVSRELGLPAVVGLSDATSWLRDGDEVELDGTTGRVVKVQSSKFKVDQANEA